MATLRSRTSFDPTPILKIVDFFDRRKDRKTAAAERAEDRLIRGEDRNLRKEEIALRRDKLTDDQAQRTQRTALMRPAFAAAKLIMGDEAGYVTDTNQDLPEGQGIVSATYDPKARTITTHPEQGEKFTTDAKKLLFGLAMTDPQLYRTVTEAIESGEGGINPDTGKRWGTAANAQEMASRAQAKRDERLAVLDLQATTKAKRALEKAGKVVEKERSKEFNDAKDQWHELWSGEGRLAIPEKQREQDLLRRLRDSAGSPQERLAIDLDYRERLKRRMTRESIDLEDKRAAGRGAKTKEGHARELRERERGIKDLNARLRAQQTTISENYQAPSLGADFRANLANDSRSSILNSNERASLDRAAGGISRTEAPAAAARETASPAPVAGATEQLPGQGPQQPTQTESGLAGQTNAPILNTSNTLVDRYRQRFPGASREQIEEAIERGQRR